MIEVHFRLTSRNTTGSRTAVCFHSKDSPNHSFVLAKKKSIFRRTFFDRTEQISRDDFKFSAIRN